MNPVPDADGASGPLTGPDDDATGLPLLPTWSKIYLLVLAAFIVYVVLMVALARVFA